MRKATSMEKHTSPIAHASAFSTISLTNSSWMLWKAASVVSSEFMIAKNEHTYLVHENTGTSGAVLARVDEDPERAPGCGLREVGRREHERG